MISPMGIMALSNSLWVPYLLVSLSSWRMFQSWTQHAERLHSLRFVPSILYGGIRRSWCINRLSICICIPNRHLPTWEISGRLKSTAPRLFPIPEHVQPPDPTDRSRQWPGVQLFILYVGICIPMPPAHETTIPLPFVPSIPGFSGLSACTVTSFTYIRLSNFLSLQARMIYNLSYGSGGAWFR